MKTIEEKAKEYLNSQLTKVDKETVNGLTLYYFQAATVDGYIKGHEEANAEWQEKTRWKSFNEEMPKFPCSIEVKSKNNFAQAVHWVTQESYERSIKIFDLWRYNIDLPIGEK